MSTIRSQSSSSNTEQELVQEILQLMDPHTYSSLMELSGTKSSGRAYGSNELNTYTRSMGSDITDSSERGYGSGNFDNYPGLIDSSTTGHYTGEYGSYNSYTNQDSSITGHSSGDFGSYNSGTEYSQRGYGLDNHHNYTGPIDSSVTGSSDGEYGSYNMVPSPRVPDISNSLPQTPINSEDMYGNYSMNDSGYSNQGDYEPKYLDISNYGPEHNNIKQETFSTYSPSTEYHTDQGIYDSVGLDTCDNDQTWDIIDDVEFKHSIHDDVSYLSSGMDQLHLETPFDNAKPVRRNTRTRKPPKDVNVSPDAMHVINKMIPGSGRRARCPKNWEFLMRLLANTETNPSVICWEDRDNYVFRLVEPEKMMQMWNERTHKCSQSYDNFARGLRYHYQKGILQPVPEKQLVYRCGPVAIQYFNNIGSS